MLDHDLEEVWLIREEREAHDREKEERTLSLKT
jgi:hypothetical protein